MHSVKLDSTLTGTHVGHWWRQKGYLARIATMCQLNYALVGTTKPLNKGVDDAVKHYLCNECPIGR